MFGVQTRYVVKYRHCDGKLVLKVTDNKEVCMCLLLCLFFVVLAPDDEFSMLISLGNVIAHNICYLIHFFCLLPAMS